MKRNNKGVLFINILLLAAIAVGVIIFAANKELAPTVGVSPSTQNGNGDQAPSGELVSTGLVISEVMISNSGAVRDNFNEYPDWVELYNGTDAPINLSGYALSDRGDNAAKFPLPTMELPAKGYIVVYLSGRGQNAASAPLHATFKLKEGETLYLFTGSSTADQFTPEATEANTSYIRTAEGFTTTALYSPGYENTEAGHQQFTAASDLTATSTLKINEVQSSNLSTVQDETGAYPDWVEIINLGSDVVDLTGYGLSDNESKPMRWVFSSGSIAPGETLLVFCSGVDKQDTPIKHAPFGISGAGETVLLYNAQGALLDKVDVPELKDDASYARDPSDGTYAQTYTPTPGAANTTDNALSALNAFFHRVNQGVYISEVMTNNASVTVDGETGDWVEIVNGTGAEVDLSGYGLSNAPARAQRYTFPSKVLAAGERVLVKLSGAVSEDAYTASFKGSSTGERLYLFNPEHTMVDKMIVPALDTDITYGRGDDLSLFYYKEATPKQQNSANAYIGLTQQVRFSEPSGLKDAPVTVELSVPDNAPIYYTTDCREPTASDTLYSGPIQLSSTTVLRAAAIKDGYLTGQTTTSTYIIGQSHTVRVVSLVTEPDNLFSDEKGIYANGPNWKEAFPHGAPGTGANFWMDWERPVSVEIFDNSGETLIHQDGEFKLNGQYSRALDQKSFSVYARAEYGESRFNAALFDDRDFTSYKSFVLRSTAQDYNRSRMRDAMITSLMQGEDVMYQETEVCVLYLNGKYWGHYNMRERVNKWSIAQNEGVTDQTVIDNIDLLKGNGNNANRVLNGDNDDYLALVDYVKAHDLRDADALAYVMDRMDVQNYFDYQIAEIYWANSDNGNIKYYRVPGGKWKWILFDLDWAMNNSSSLPVSWNTFESVINPKGTGVGDSFYTDLICGLLKNPDMQQLFLERLAYFMQNVYTPEKAIAAIDSLEATMEPEMQQHFERWEGTGSVEKWKKQVDSLRSWVRERPQYVMTNCQSFFSLSDSQMASLFGELWTNR